MFSAGVNHWNQNNEMDELMLFLATYVRTMHADRYYKNVLSLHPGASYLDIITPSDIAYTCALMRNSSHVWAMKLGDSAETDKPVKPLFTSGKGKKRTFGVTTWNKAGMDYFDEAKQMWMGAYNKNDPQYKILRNYWDKWIKTEGKEVWVMNRDGLGKKSIYSILRMREKGELQEVTAAEHRDEDDDEEQFAYDSDPYDEAIDIGNWNTKRGSRSGGNKAVEDEGEEEEFDSDDDSSSSGNDINNNNMDESEADEEEEEQEGEIESSNLLQREIEMEAQVAGGRRKAKRKNDGQVEVEAQGNKRVGTRKNGARG